MSQSARKNSHVSSACVNCRRRKKKCSGSKPTCALCAENNVQCEWTVESDGRRGCGRERDALRLENEQLKSELALLQAQLRGPGVENAHNGLAYNTVVSNTVGAPGSRGSSVQLLIVLQMQQLWVPDVPVDCAGLEFQTSVAQQAAAPVGAFADTTAHALTAPADSWLYSYRAQDGPPALTEDAAGPSVDATRMHAVNVFGPHEPPLSTSDAHK